MARAAAYPDKMNPIGNSVGYDIRPIQPDDRDRMIGLFNHLSPHSRYLRFAHAVSQLPDDFLEDILHLDYKNELALVAVIQTKNLSEEIIGIARYVSLPSEHTCEFSLSVSDDYTHQGIGTHLMQSLIRSAKENGLKKMLGYVLHSNTKMLQLVVDLGFEIQQPKLEASPDFKTVSILL